MYWQINYSEYIEIAFFTFDRKISMKVTIQL